MLSEEAEIEPRRQRGVSGIQGPVTGTGSGGGERLNRLLSRAFGWYHTGRDGHAAGAKGAIVHRRDKRLTIHFIGVFQRSGDGPNPNPACS